MQPPTTAQIGAWKASYGEIYEVDLRGKPCYYRSLNFKELKLLTSVADSWSVVDMEDFIVSSAVLYPDSEWLENLPAGLYSSLADAIRDVSGLGDAKSAIATLQTARDSAANVLNLAKIYILATMPAYREEELEELTATQLFHKVAMAEQIIALNQTAMMGNSVEFTIIDPEEEERRQEEEENKRREAAERFAKRGGKHVNADAAPPLKPRITNDDPIARKLRGG